MRPAVLETWSVVLVSLLELGLPSVGLNDLV